MGRSDASSEPVEVEDAYATGETEPGRKNSGVLFVVVDGRKVMIPKKMIDDDSEVYARGDRGTLVIPEWLALDRGLI